MVRISDCTIAGERPVHAVMTQTRKLCRNHADRAYDLATTVDGRLIDSEAPRDAE